MRELDWKLSRGLTSMGFVCACLIVLTHGTVFPAADRWQWWVARIVGKDGLSRIAVPFFFLASGFFLAGHVGEQGWYFRAVRSRINSLIVPFAIWRVIDLCVVCVISWAISVSGYDYHGSIHFPNFSGRWLIGFLGFDLFLNIGVLWYVRTLFIFVLLSPLLVMALSRRFSFFTFVAIISAYALLKTYGCEWGCWRVFFEYGLSLRGLLYFSAGLFFRFNNFDCKRKWIVLAYPLAILGVVTKAVLRHEDLSIGAEIIDIVMVPALMLCVWNAVKHIDLKWMGMYSFQIYLMHQNILLVITIGLASIGFSAYAKVSLLIMFARVAAAIVIASGLTWFMRKYMPMFSKIAFGGR